MLRTAAVPIKGVVVSTRRNDGRKRRPARRTAGAYLLVARGPDGRARCESFRDTGAYRSRLASLSTNDGAVSLDDVVDLLTKSQSR
jgi:hypothetical protein